MRLVPNRRIGISETLVLPAVAGAALLAALGPLPALAGLGLCAALLITVAPSLALPLLIATSALNRYGYAWGDTDIRIEILVAFLLALLVTNAVLVRTAPKALLCSPLVVPLGGYLGINVLSTLLLAADRTRGLKLDVQIAAVICTYVAVLYFLAPRGRLRLALDMMWFVTTLEALVGLVAALLYALHIVTFGVQFDPFGLPMVYGTMWEANIFGSFLLGNFFLLLSDFIATKKGIFPGLALLLILGGIGVSMTRTVWMALVLGSVVFGFLFARKRAQAQILIPIIGTVLVLGLVGLVLGSATPLAGRVADLVNLQSSSASGRLVWFGAALADWVHSPILGLGTGSFNYGAVPGGPHPWLPNLFLLTLHDTGVVGLAILMVLLVRFFQVCAAGMSAHSAESTWVLGGCVGFAMLLLAFQTTSGFWFAYPWILAGVTMTAAVHARRGTEE